MRRRATTIPPTTWEVNGKVSADERGSTADTLPSSPPDAPSPRQAEGPRLVRTVVCAYSRQELPGWWLQVFRRFDRAIARAGWRIRVRLMPLEDLPERFEVLVIPPHLREQAAALRTGALTMCVNAQEAPYAVEELLRGLQSGKRIYAERATGDEPKIVIHRGWEVL